MMFSFNTGRVKITYTGPSTLVLSQICVYIGKYKSPHTVRQSQVSFRLIHYDDMKKYKLIQYLRQFYCFIDYTLLCPFEKRLILVCLMKTLGIYIF